MFWIETLLFPGRQAAFEWKAGCLWMTSSVFTQWVCRVILISSQILWYNTVFGLLVTFVLVGFGRISSWLGGSNVLWRATSLYNCVPIPVDVLPVIPTFMFNNSFPVYTLKLCSNPTMVLFSKVMELTTEHLDGFVWIFGVGPDFLKFTIDSVLDVHQDDITHR